MNSVLWVMGFNMIQWFNAFCLLRLLNSVGHCAVDSGMRVNDAANELWLENGFGAVAMRGEFEAWAVLKIFMGMFLFRGTFTRLCEIWVRQLTKLQNRKPLLFCHCIRFQEPPQEANAALLSAAVAQHRKLSSCWETQNNPTWQGLFVDSKQLWTLVGCPEPSRNFRFQVFFSHCYNQPRVQVLFSSTRSVWSLASTPFRCLWENITTDTSSLALAFRKKRRLMKTETVGVVPKQNSSSLQC